LGVRKNNADPDPQPCFQDGGKKSCHKEKKIKEKRQFKCIADELSSDSNVLSVPLFRQMKKVKHMKTTI
jgi:hypothetical protein